MSRQRFFGGLRATLKRLSLPAGVLALVVESAQIDVDLLRRHEHHVGVAVVELLVVEADRLISTLFRWSSPG